MRRRPPPNSRGSPLISFILYLPEKGKSIHITPMYRRYLVRLSASKREAYNKQREDLILPRKTAGTVAAGATGKTVALSTELLEEL